MTHLAVDVVKRAKRPTESFQQQKLHKSIHAACLSVRARPGEADVAATNVCNAVIIWLDDKPEITSNDLRRIAAQHLQKFHPDAAYIYEHQHYTL